MALLIKPDYDPKVTRWWWRPLRKWVYALVDPLWAALRGENSDDIALTNVTALNDLSAAEIDILNGITATTAELNNLSGLTANATQINKLDRSSADGLAEASRAPVLDSNLDLMGGRFHITRSILEATSQSPAAYLDGVNDEITVSDHGDLDFGAGDFSLIVRAVIGSFVNNGSSYNVLAGKSAIVVGPASFYGLALQSDSKLRFILNATTGSQADSDSMLNDGQVHHIAGVRSGGTVQLFVDGQLQSVTGSNSSSVSNSDDLYIGSDGSAARRLQSTIFEVLLFNRALTGTDIRSLLSGRPVLFDDTGASQAETITNGEDWTGANGATPPNSWSDSGAGTATYSIRDNSTTPNFMDNKVLELATSSGSKTLAQTVATKGKRYRVSFVYRNLEGTTPTYVALGSDGNKTTLTHTLITGDGIIFVQEFLADDTDLKFFVDSGGILQIDHLSVVQVGCVANYRPGGINPSQWLDSSGNGHHGDLTGVTMHNLPADHRTRIVKTGITADTAFTGLIPAGYRIASALAEVSGAAGGMLLNLGTAAGGAQVVNGADISGNGLVDLTLAQAVYSLTADQTLHVSDDGGTAWSGVSVNLYLELVRLK